MQAAHFDASRPKPPLHGRPPWLVPVSDFIMATQVNLQHFYGKRGKESFGLARHAAAPRFPSQSVSHLPAIRPPMATEENAVAWPPVLDASLEASTAMDDMSSVEAKIPHAGPLSGANQASPAQDDVFTVPQSIMASVRPSDAFNSWCLL